MPENVPASGSPSRYSERRRHPRVEARLKIRTNGPSPGLLTTTNISLGGAFGETNRFFQVGSRIHCVLTPPRHTSIRGTVEAVADVLRSTAEGTRDKRSFFAAIQFVEIEAERKDRLHELLRQLSGIDYPG